MFTTWKFVVPMAIATVMAGCDGSPLSQGGACLDATACGGDPTGRWNVSSFCYNSRAVVEVTARKCPGFTAEFGDIKVSGTADFNADGTYVTHFNPTGTVRELFPDGCFGTADPAAFCKSLGASDPFDNPGGTFQCEKTASACSCVFTYSPDGIRKAGTWTAAGGKLFVEGENTTFTNYCQQGSFLQLIDHLPAESDGMMSSPNMMDMMNPMRVLSVISLKK